MKRQTSLARFGCTKKIKNRNSDPESKVPDFVKINEQRIKCDFSTEKFVNQQSYSVHLKYKHTWKVVWIGFETIKNPKKLATFAYSDQLSIHSFYVSIFH